MTLPKDSEESQQILDRYSPQISKSEFDENDWDVEQPAEKLLNSSSNKEPSIPSTMATTNTHITDQLVTGKVNDGNKEHLVKKYRSVQTSGWYIFRNCFGLCCFKPVSCSSPSCLVIHYFLIINNTLNTLFCNSE